MMDNETGVGSATAGTGAGCNGLDVDTAALPEQALPEPELPVQPEVPSRLHCETHNRVVVDAGTLGDIGVLCRVGVETKDDLSAGMDFWKLEYQGEDGITLPLEVAFPLETDSPWHWEVRGLDALKLQAGHVIATSDAGFGGNGDSWKATVVDTALLFNETESSKLARFINTSNAMKEQSDKIKADYDALKATRTEALNKHAEAVALGDSADVVTPLKAALDKADKDLAVAEALKNRAISKLNRAYLAADQARVLFGE